MNLREVLQWRTKYHVNVNAFIVNAEYIECRLDHLITEEARQALPMGSEFIDKGIDAPMGQYSIIIPKNGRVS